MEKFCCDRMADDLNQLCKDHPDRRECPDALISKVRGGYGIIIHDGGSSVIEISYCPWCGSKLPPIGDMEETDFGPADDSDDPPT